MTFKRILIATGIFVPDIGGPASYARALGTCLAAQRSVSVLTYSSVWSYPADKTLSFSVLRVWRKNLRLLRHLVFFLRLLGQARHCDVILALNAASVGVPCLIAAKLLRKQFVVRIAGDHAWEMAVQRRKTALLINDFQHAKKSGWISFLHKMQVWVCRNARTVIVPSRYLADLVRGWDIPEEKIRVVYNGIDFTPSRMTKEEARKKIGISGNIILSVGRFAPWKGFRMLIKILPQLLGINQFFRLVIVGEGPERAILTSIVRNLGLERKVYLVSKKSSGELAEYFAAADMFILNSGYEGFSHQILEAMSAGVPVIASAAGGNKEIIRQGENGFLVKYNDEFNLMQAIETLWKINDLREQFVSEGKKTVQDFSIERMVKETVRILDL